MKACVVGSGPAGFYSAYRLLANLPDCTVDIYECLPVPYGLARFGVAPDHPEVKNVTHKFDEVASSPRAKFYGNVTIGKDIAVEDLAKTYDCILFAHGASRNRNLSIPGEDLSGVMSARSFVGWYNALPEAAGSGPDLQRTDTAVVIGQGNVALDIARILLSSVDDLRKTDIAEHALEALAGSKIKRVNIVGRRGPLQASFTIKEIRELVNLPDVTFMNDSRSQYTELLTSTTLPRPQKRLIDLLAKQEKAMTSAKRAWDIQYALSPTHFNGTPSGALESITFEKNSLVEVGGQIKAHGTGEMLKQDAQLAFLSIGYQSEAIPGMEDIGIVFDTHKHIIPNDNGRVTSLDGLVDGVYCSGWAKVGPVGVIASTMRDAFETADFMTKDWLSSTPKKELELQPVELITSLSKKKQVVRWDDWKRIEKYEMEQGAKAKPARPAHKITSIEEMLRIAREA